MCSQVQRFLGLGSTSYSISGYNHNDIPFASLSEWYHLDTVQSSCYTWKRVTLVLTSSLGSKHPFKLEKFYFFKISWNIYNFILIIDSYFLLSLVSHYWIIKDVGYVLPASTTTKREDSCSSLLRIPSLSSRTKWFADSLSCSHTEWRKNSFFPPKMVLTWSCCCCSRFSCGAPFSLSP